MVYTSRNYLVDRRLWFTAAVVAFSTENRFTAVGITLRQVCGLHLWKWPCRQQTVGFSWRSTAQRPASSWSAMSCPGWRGQRWSLPSRLTRTPRWLDDCRLPFCYCWFSAMGMSVSERWVLVTLEELLGGWGGGVRGFSDCRCWVHFPYIQWSFKC